MNVNLTLKNHAMQMFKSDKVNIQLSRGVLLIIEKSSKK